MTGVCEDDYCEDDIFADELMLRVQLTPPEQTALGRDSADVDALALASWVLEFWRTRKIY
jgi:hypothetical protein